MHGARVVALRGNFDEALTLVRELVQRHPIALVNSVNPYRLEGQKTASMEIAEELGPIDALAIPVGNAGNITAYWKGFQEVDESPMMLGFQAEGAAPLVHGEPVREPGDGGERDPDRQPGALGGGDGGDDGLARRRARRLRRADPRRLPVPGRRRGRVLRAGLGHQRRGRARRTARRAPSASCACSPATGSRTRRPRWPTPARSCRASRTSTPSSRPSWLERVATSASRPRRPTSGPASTCWRRRSASAMELEVTETGRFEVRTDLAIARDARNLCVRGFAALRPAEGMRFTIRSDIPLSGGLGHERGRLRGRPRRRRRAERRRRRPARRGRARSKGTRTTPRRR